MRTDLKFAFRQLAKSPGFTAVAVLSLALGIGANTAVFSLVNAVLLQMLPVKNPEQLVVFNWLADENVEPPHLSGYRTREPGSNKYSSTSFSVAALEAFRAQVLQMILRESLTLVVLGVLVGVAISVGATRWIASLLFGLPADDPITSGCVALLLLAVATVACLLPARRAAKIDPMVALRSE